MSTTVDLMPGDVLGKNIRTAGYMILVWSAIFPLFDLAGALIPASFGNATWRFGAVGLLANFAMGLSLEFFLLAVIAASAGHRRVLLALGVVSVLLAVLLLGSSALFALDALQTRGKVNAGMVRRFDYATGTAMAKLLLYALANIVLARGDFFLANRFKRTTSMRTRGMAPLVATPSAQREKGM